MTLELETRLKAFIPEYIPAVGEVDAFLKIPKIDNSKETLGLVSMVSDGFTLREVIHSIGRTEVELV